MISYFSPAASFLLISASILALSTWYGPSAPSFFSFGSLVSTCLMNKSSPTSLCLVDRPVHKVSLLFQPVYESVGLFSLFHLRIMITLFMIDT